MGGAPPGASGWLAGCKKAAGGGRGGGEGGALPGFCR